MQFIRGDNNSEIVFLFFVLMTHFVFGLWTQGQYSQSFVSCHHVQTCTTTPASFNGLQPWLVGAEDNGNQPCRPDKAGTLQLASDMSGGDSDRGSFSHLAQSLAAKFTLGSVYTAE